jgi:hypothetical protein
LGRTAELRLSGVLLIAVAAACWAVTANRMQGMDMGPGTDLGSLGWFAGVWLTMMAAMGWHEGGRYVAGTVILAAALYELTPAKRICLGHCRAPRRPAASSSARGSSRAPTAWAAAGRSWPRSSRSG